MTLVRRQKRPAQKDQASKAPIDWSNNKNYEDSLRSNKLKPSKAPTGYLQALFLAFPTLDITWYMQKDIDHLLQTFLQASKSGSGDNLKAKILDVYCNRSHIECYNFCQQYEKHFATYGATGLN